MCCIIECTLPLVDQIKRLLNVHVFAFCLFSNSLQSFDIGGSLDIVNVQIQIYCLIKATLT